MSLSQFHEDPDRVSDSNQWLSQERKNCDKFLFLLGSEKILVDMVSSCNWEGWKWQIMVWDDKKVVH